MKTLFKILTWLLLALLLVIGGFIAATWAPDVPVDDLKPRWAKPPSQFITVQGLSVHLRDEGPRDDAVPIVLLHGTSASLHTWEGWAQSLKSKRRVIRFDLPGFALTGPNAQNDYSIARYVQFVDEVLNALNVQRCVIAGNSLGGQIAWAYAVAKPHRVDKLILVDASGYTPKAKSLPIGFRLAGMPLLRDVARHTLPRFVIEQSVRNVYGDPSKVTPELVDLYRDMTLRAGNREALSRRLQQGYQGKEENIKTLKLPTLILWGRRDKLIPPEFADKFQHDIQGAQKVMFDALGHVPQEEDPQATVAALKKFLGLEG
jgi:pimeloyl-ACP methyl ester carboxylesterase